MLTCSSRSLVPGRISLLYRQACMHDAAEEKTWWNKPGFHLSYMEDYPPYPYQRIKSEDGKDTGVIALIAPFYALTYYRVWGKLTLA